MTFKKGKKKKPNCSITFSYRRKKKEKANCFGEKIGRINPTSSSDCSIISTSSPGMSRFLLFFISSSHLSSISPSLHLSISSYQFPFFPFLHLIRKLRRLLLYCALLFFISSSHLFSISPSLLSLHLSRALSFPFPSLFISPPENYPCFSLLLIFFLFKSKGRSLDLELIFTDKMGFINFFIN